MLRISSQISIFVLFAWLGTAHCFFAIWPARVVGQLPPNADDSVASEKEFSQSIRPLLKTHCFDCHNAEEQEGEINLAALGSNSELVDDADLLESVLEAVEEGFMPPQDFERPLGENDRGKIVAWARDRLYRMALSQAGDPGKVVVRRLTNAELNYTLGDLTGLRWNWSQEFPRDSGGGEGFSNTGQTLQMSASQIEKYLSLSQRLVDHALMLPGSGPLFLETPVSTLTDVERARIALQRLDEFCRTHQFVYSDVTPRQQITSYAYPDDKSSQREGYQHMTGYKAFSARLPGDVFQFVGSTHRLFYRTEKLNPTPFSYMIHRGEISSAEGVTDTESGVSDRQQEIWNSLWFDFRYTTNFARPAKISLLHRWFSHQAYRLGDNPALEVELTKWKVGDGKSPDGYRRYSLDPQVDLSFSVIALAGYLGDIRSFSATDLEIYANIQQSGDGESRTLMVPNHDAFDAFIDLSLNDEQIEQLWTLVCDPNSKLAERLGGVPGPELQEQWAKWTDQQQAWHSSVLSSAQVAICKFASRVWRRPLEKQEREAICDTLAAGIKQGQSLQDASLLPLFRIFMSPHFLYRIEIGEVAPADDASPLAETKRTRELSQFELANRLSYFLWSSPPDELLRDAAQRGELSQTDVLVEHARRMMIDPRIRRFSREMFGQWLGFYWFQEFDRPNQERFPEFDEELRTAMYHEAVDFCTDLMANDRDVRSLLNADYTFANRRLAEHYAVETSDEQPSTPSGGSDRSVTEFPRVSLASTSRRGVLGWGSILTSNSHALRTSPVLRGSWVLDDLLGIPTPAPPNAVPELPEDEKNQEGLTIAQLMSRHRQDRACAVCHDRIDPLGLAMENYDPIGRFREQDLNDQRIEAVVTLHDGKVIEGSQGLVDFLQQAEQQELFARRLSRKFLGFALGRETAPGDTQLLDEIYSKLENNGFRVSNIVESIVISPQFRRLRYEVGEPRGRSKP